MTLREFACLGCGARSESDTPPDRCWKCGEPGMHEITKGRKK